MRNGALSFELGVENIKILLSGRIYIEKHTTSAKCVSLNLAGSHTSYNCFKQTTRRNPSVKNLPLPNSVRILKKKGIRIEF